MDIKSEMIPHGKKVCVIGAGPSGLTAANVLALRGYKVTMLEQFDELGGMLCYCILPYLIQKVEGTNRIREYDFIDRQPMDEIPIHERREKNREVEIGFHRRKD